MRRAIAALVLTVAGLYLVLAYKSSPVARTATSVATPAPTTAAPSPPGAGGPPPAGPPPPPGAGQPTATTAGGTRTVTGPVVSTQYGDVQVRITLDASGRITDIQPLQLPFDRPRSEFISQQAAPLLQQEVLDAQSAQIDTISGATYTSDAYAQSLQGALDAAHRG